jgi:hypothetical protein
LETREGESATLPGARFEPPSLRRLILANKRISAVVGAILVALIAIVVVADLVASVSAVTDSTPCSAWSSANQRQRDAYASLYVREHGPLAGGTSRAAAIETAIDNGCAQAYGFNEEDAVTVLQAIRRQY